MNINKTLLACAIGTAMGLGATSASAETLIVTGWNIQNINDDGTNADTTTSDFNFVSKPDGTSVNAWGATAEQCGGSACVDIAFDSGSQGINTFTTGFIFGVAPNYFEPFVGGSMNATIDSVQAAAGNGQAVQFGALGFAGHYQRTALPPGSIFSLAPDHLMNCTGQPAGVLNSCGESGTADTNPVLNAPLGYNVVINDLGGGDYGVIVDYASTITEAGSFLGNEAHWRIEGVMSTTAIPVPAAVWLFGSGLLGLVGVARRKKVS